MRTRSRLMIFACMAWLLSPLAASSAAEALQQSADPAVAVSDERIALMPGQSMPLRVSIDRRRGRTAAVQVRLTGLPPGVTAQPIVIPADGTQAEMTIVAGSTAPHSLPTAATLRVTSTAATTGSRQPLTVTVTVRGPAGAVDASFAGGAAITALDIGEDHARAVAVQADGRIVVAGSSGTSSGTKVALMRYLRDGSLDLSFGQGGRVLLALDRLGNDGAAGLAIQRDGRIVVAGSVDRGSGNTDFAVLRFLGDGSPDVGFGAAGRCTIDFAGGGDRAWAVLIQDDGRIVVGGEANLGSATTGIDFALARLTPDGALDPGFGHGGKLTTAIKSHAGTDVVRALAIQRIDGSDRILAVGGEGDFLAARYHADGMLDAGFGAGGKVVGLFGDVMGAARAVVALPSGEAVLAGHIGHRFAAARLTADGRLDLRFGNGGTFQLGVVSGWNEATGLARQADGKLVVGGWAATGNSSSNDFAALRLDADGTLDRSFAVGGVLVAPTAAGQKSDQANALALQTDDRVPTVRAILAGEASASNNDIALRRLWL